MSTAPAPSPSAKPPHVKLTSITKSFGPVTVLKDVSLDILPGEVHVLAGENGAGKSTLMKVLGGVITDYQGQIEIGGKPARPSSPNDAAHHGVAVIHQELSLIPHMSVADNLFLGDPPTKAGFVRAGVMREDARGLLRRVGLEIDPDAEVASLPLATRQLVEVAKALRRADRVLVMDEPTSALNTEEAARLFALIAELKAQGVGIVYISHKMDEIERLADRITVLRDGQWVATAPAAEVPPARLVELMVGDRGLRPETATPNAPPTGPVVFEVKDVSVRDGRKSLAEDVSFSVRAGEVVGLAGLEGSGSSHVLLGLFGAYGKLAKGSVTIHGETYPVKDPQAAIRAGLALLTNDRKGTGLVLPLSIIANTTLAAMKRYSPGGWRKPKLEVAAAQAQAKAFSLRAASLEMAVGELSGGNQQKVALAKWMETQPRVLLLDEPTRGIDIGAKREIYALMEQWKAEGLAIVLITSELPELLLLADRILVMHRGRISAEFDRANATGERIINAAMSHDAQ
ncbi:MAG: sugar ABC transporter ATP-binding protein [Fimbriimonas sp.]